MENLQVKSMTPPQAVDAGNTANDGAGADTGTRAAANDFPAVLAQQLSDVKTALNSVSDLQLPEVAQDNNDSCPTDKVASDPSPTAPSMPILALLQNAAILLPAVFSQPQPETDAGSASDTQTAAPERNTGGADAIALILPQGYSAQQPGAVNVAAAEPQSGAPVRNAGRTNSIAQAVAAGISDPRPETAATAGAGSPAGALERKAEHTDTTAQNLAPGNGLSGITDAIRLAADRGANGDALAASAEQRPRGRNIDVRDIDLLQSSAAAGNQQAPGTTAAPAAPLRTELQISMPLDHADWGNELGKRMAWMLSGKQHVAEIHINPPDLGPVAIKLTLDGSATTAVFTSPHLEVRQAIESALPGLREVLADSGIMLGNASVTADSPQDGMAFARSWEQASRNPATVTRVTPEAEPLRTISPRSLRGTVDLFA